MTKQKQSTWIQDSSVTLRTWYLDDFKTDRGTTLNLWPPEQPTDPKETDGSPLRSTLGRE